MGGLKARGQAKKRARGPARAWARGRVGGWAGVFKISAALFCLLFAVAGCGTVDLNRAVTDTACAGRAQCLKDLNLPGPAAPEYVFVVDPYTLDQKAKGAFGASLLGPVNRADVDLCVAKALAEEFGDKARIVFDKKGLNGPYAGIKIDRADFRSAYTAGWSMEIDYRLTARGKSIPLAAKTGIENFWSARKAVETQYLRACRVLAREVKENLK
ncbi:MAG: hypothetical protein M0033_10125 [Nitrospiraceae bacterium]|nr:hypothetical protein [Nitrospiraceae bacterium]